MNEYPYLDEYYNSVKDNCKYLNIGSNVWEIDKGWYKLVSDLSYKLEMMNFQFYPKYNVRIVPEQIKEKFGGLRYYYTVIVEAPWYYTFLGKFFEKLFMFIKKHVDFRLKKIVVNPYHTNHILKIGGCELMKDVLSSCSNVKVIESEIPGRYIRICDDVSYRQQKLIPTRFKFVFDAQELCRYLSYKLDFSGYFVPSKKQRFIQSYVDKMTENLVKDAERSSYNICEKCGFECNDKTHPRCETTGWITILCQRCAEASGQDYWMNGKKYRGNEMINDTKETSKDLI